MKGFWFLLTIVCAAVVVLTAVAFNAYPYQAAWNSDPLLIPTNPSWVRMLQDNGEGVLMISGFGLILSMICPGVGERKRQ